MARRKQWTMSPGEELVLSVDMSRDMEDGVTLSSPSVTVYTKSGTTYTDATADFTVEAEQINASAITREDGGTTAIGDGVVFRLTASTTQGTYYVVVQATGDDGTTIKTERVLVVSGGA